MKLWTVYDGGALRHPGEAIVSATVSRWELTGEVISDRVAQEIASWFHSPREPYSTVLSTQGKVDHYMTLDAFGDPEQFEGFDRACLLALGAYIADRKSTAESGYRPCACHTCMSVAIGSNGALCSGCEEWGCDPADDRNVNGCEAPRDE
jgi:hypothetical protein